jgi:hypothetical protein
MTGHLMAGEPSKPQYGSVQSCRPGNLGGCWWKSWSPKAGDAGVIMSKGRGRWCQPLCLFGLCRKVGACSFWVRADIPYSVHWFKRQSLLEALTDLPRKDTVPAFYASLSLLKLIPGISHLGESLTQTGLPPLQPHLPWFVLDSCTSVTLDFWSPCFLLA